MILIRTYIIIFIVYYFITIIIFQYFVILALILSLNNIIFNYKNKFKY